MVSMLKERNGVARRSAVGKSGEPCRNVSTNNGDARRLRSSTRRDRERPTAEPVEAGKRPNKSVATGSSTDHKWRIGCVKLTRGQHRDVPRL